MAILPNQKNIFASSKGKNFTSVGIDNSAPVYSYKPKNSALQTWALKDSAGQEHYLTDQGNWRNTSTMALSKTMPTWAAAPATAAPAAPASQSLINPPAPASSYIPAGYTGPTTPFNNAGFLDLQAQKAAAGQKITPQEYGALGGDLREYYKMYGDAPPPVAAPAPTPMKGIMDFLSPETKQSFLAPQAPVVAPTASTYNAPLMDQIKSFQDFMPKDFMNSPAYQLAMEEGNKRLSNQLAAMGKLGSGTEIESRNDLSRKVLADEVQRSMDMAGQTYQGYLGDRTNQQQAQLQALRDNTSADNTFKADKYRQDSLANENLKTLLANFAGTDYAAYNQNMNSALDREQGRDQQSQQLFGTILDYMKSLNPMANGFAATEQSAADQQKLGALLAQMMGSGGGGGGGGGGGSTYTAQPSPITGVPTGNFLSSVGSAIGPSLGSLFGSLFK